jgi:TM2 domain-containing membrane protein YozV
MKILAILLNFFFPGVGSMVIGKVGTGVTQLLLYVVGIFLSLTVVLAIIGVPLCLGAWIWGLVTAANSPEQPIQVTVVQGGPITANQGRAA